MPLLLLLLLPFAVDLPRDPEFAQSNAAILAACDDALRPRRCAPAVDEGRASVRVRWATPENAQIDEWDGERWRRQTLLFTAEDKPSERFRAVGLVVAALASGTRAAPVTRVAEPHEASKPAVGFDVRAAFLTGPGVASGHWRSGLQTSLGVRARGWPLGVRAQVAGSFAGTLDSSIRAYWLGVSAGPYGVYEPLDWLRLSAGLDVGGEWLRATLSDGAMGSQQTRAYVTLRPWLGATAWLNGWLGVQAGVEFYGTPGQSLRVDGEVVGKNRSLGALALAGVELRLLQ